MLFNAVCLVLQLVSDSFTVALIINYIVLVVYEVDGWWGLSGPGPAPAAP